MEWKSDRADIFAAQLFVLILLAADLVFIGLHLILMKMGIDKPHYSLEIDRAYPEIYQYIKEFWIVVLLVVVVLRTRVFGYAVWVSVFFYLLLDDSLSIHESVGGFFVDWLRFQPGLGLRAQDFGEIAVSGLSATVFVIMLAAVYRRGDAQFRIATKHLLVLVVGLAFFGVFVDMLHIILVGWAINPYVGVIEDGGEMLMISLIAGYVFLLSLRCGPEPTELQAG